MIEAQPERWLDKRGLALHLACGVRTIERALTQGMPHTVIFGRVKFRASEVDAWLDRTGQIERRGNVILDEGDPPAHERRRIVRSNLNGAQDDPKQQA